MRTSHLNSHTCPSAVQSTMIRRCLLTLPLVLFCTIGQAAARDNPVHTGSLAASISDLHRAEGDPDGLGLASDPEDGDARTDSLALIAFFNATGGASWTTSTNWLTGPLSTWYGVTTVGGRVTTLSLPANNLVGPIPDDLFVLTQLTVLILAGNALDGPISPSIKDLSLLEHLDLGDNLLSGTLPSELGSLTRLRFLRLGPNRVEGAIPAELGSLNNLEELYLYYSWLSGQIPTSLGSLSRLRRLHLEGNALTGGLPSELGTLSSLIVLEAHTNQLSGPIPAEFAGLTSLEILYIHTNPLQGQLPPELGALRHLRQLHVSRTNLLGFIPRSFLALPLWNLEFAGTSICVPSRADFADWLSGISALATSGIACPRDFQIPVQVTDASGNSVELGFGTDPEATDDFDPELDQLAPPPPPAGSFDARFRTGNEDYLIDVRPQSADEHVWTLLAQADSWPITVSWGQAVFPQDGGFKIGTGVPGSRDQDMRLSSEIVLPGPSAFLRIVHRTWDWANRKAEAGWTLVGMPLQALDMRRSALFPSARNRSLFAYDAGYFEPASGQMVTGAGYWLYFQTPEDIRVSGDFVPTMEIGLERGWNLISGPNCDLSVAQIQDQSSLVLQGTLFKFAGSYEPADVLVPGFGYWVRSAGSGTVTLSCLPTASKESVHPTTGLLDRFAAFVITEASGDVHRLYFGAELPDATAPGAFTLPPPAPGQGWIPTFPEGRYVSSGESSTVSLIGALFPLDVVADRSLQLTVLAADGKVMETIALAPGRHYRMDDRLAAELRLKSSSSSTEVPGDFRLEPAFPNPFSTATAIRFTMPDASPIKLEIFDSLGRRVADLSRDEPLAAGNQEIRFEANGLADGVYFVVLRSGRRTETRSVVLLR